MKRNLLISVIALAFLAAGLPDLGLRARQCGAARRRK